MCGIAGLIGPFEINLLNDKINLLTGHMLHRGPDSGGQYVKKGIALGHRRLSIIDLSNGANQPFIDPSGRYILVFNGEIYNFMEVKAKLGDYNFKTNSDTEVILASFIKWGTRCLNQLNGMFAFAVWDDKKQELFIARDRLGVKPFYYYYNQDVFVFASEIRAIKASGILKFDIDEDSVADYLMNQSVTAPYTLFKDIYQLMPGQYGIFKNAALELHYYWKIEEEKKFTGLSSEDNVKSEVRKLLTEAIERRMISDVKLGAFLSGGIDSSAVVALMSEVSSQQVNTFTIGFKEKSFDESQYSNLIAKKYRTNHTTVILEPADFLSELPNAVKAMDTPSGDGINTYVVSKATRKAGFKVALSGVGGDELFAGYPHFKLFHKIHNSNLLNVTPRFLLKSAGSIGGAFLRGSKGERLVAMAKSKNFDIENLSPLLKQVYSSKSVTRLLNGRIFPDNRLQKLLEERKTDIHKLPVLSQFSAAELLGYTQNVLLKDADQMSMAHSLEIREPFFDYKLIEYVLQIPDTIKYPVYAKSLLVESLGDLLPSEIIHRPKMGFTFPWEHWLKNELRDFTEVHLKSLGLLEQFSADEINRLWKSFLSGAGDVKWIHIWQLVVLSVYLIQNVTLQ
jgi:asparagine synthase (glutamine-hydrolysing)